MCTILVPSDVYMYSLRFRGDTVVDDVGYCAF